MSKKADMIGKKFGRLTVETEQGHLGSHLAYKCKCDCGAEVIVRGYSLRSGNTESCGCAFKEMTGARFRTHGMRQTREYSTWQMMIARCENPNTPFYENYGGRGIKVCERWKSFEKFYEDMGQRPDGMTLDRIDNDGDYSPTNCRWATDAQQRRNTRRSILITHNGETKCLKDWATAIGMSYRTLYKRVAQLGWPIERAFAQ